MGGNEKEREERRRIARILRERREKLGMSQEELALRVGVSSSLITKLERGLQDVTKMRAINLSRLLDVLELSPADLGLDKIPGVEVGHRIPRNFLLAPVLGEAVGGRPYEYELPVPKNLHRRSTGVFVVSGDSMDDGTERAIKDGDILLVDLAQTDLRPGKVYVLEIPGDGFTVKEARKLDGEWVLLPWNPRYPPMRPDEVRVVGEVYNVMRPRGL